MKCIFSQGAVPNIYLRSNKFSIFNALNDGVDQTCGTFFLLFLFPVNCGEHLADKYVQIKKLQHLFIMLFEISPLGAKVLCEIFQTINNHEK